MRFKFPFIALIVGVTAQSTISDELNGKIAPQVTKLANDVKGFPGSGRDGALVGSPSLLYSQSSVLTAHFRLSILIRKSLRLSLILPRRMRDLSGILV
jgi:hypothetical protein